MPAASARARDDPRAPSARPLRTSIAVVIEVEGGQESVKREEQVPITEGVEMFSSYPMQEDWL